MKEEGLSGQVAFSSILAEAVFCGNALLSVDNSTPYNGLYGRVPCILPSINQIEEPSGGSKAEPDTLRHVNRLREISVQAMVEGSARARLGRAMNIRTTMPAQRLNLQVGEEVDFFKQPSTKDTLGWNGPAEVVDVSKATRGVVTVRWNSRPLEVQLANIRRHLHFLVYLSSPLKITTSQDNALSHIKHAVENMTRGGVIQVGVVKTNSEWTRSANNSQQVGLMSAVQFFAENHLHLHNVISARAGIGL